MQMTQDSFFGITPFSINFLAVATVTPPAVSVKIPSVLARSFIPSIISWSVTDSPLPLLSLIASIVYIPSAGFPIARDLAMVFGLTGLMISLFSFKAVTTGEQPSAWAACILASTELIKPNFLNSLNDFQIFVRSEPLATGTTMWAGVLQPNCSMT